MIIFPLLLVLFACAALAGWAFGVIRATMTFLGLLVSLIVARMFAHSFESALTHVGLQNPGLLWVLAPVPPFLISLIVFKIIGFVVQQKVNHYYKYKAGDLRMGLWDRLNPRLGLCVGLANALIYMVLISLVIYVVSYPTVQLASGSGDHWSLRMLNQAGRDLQSSGLTKVVAAVDPMPENYFEAADLAGLIYHNDLLEARLGRYPAFISLGEESVFQQIAASKDFRELRQRQPPFTEILDNSLMQTIVNDPAMLTRIWDLLTPNLQDLQMFLQTGLSDKYAGDHLVGRWDVNPPGGLSEFQAATPNATSSEMRKARLEMSEILTNTTTLVATLDNKIYLKNLGTIVYVTNIIQGTPAPAAATRAGARAGAAPPAAGRGGVAGRGPAPAPPPVRQVLASVKLENLQGTWSGEGSNFRIQLSGRRTLLAVVDGDKLSVVGLNYPIVFDREY